LAFFVIELEAGVGLLGNKSSGRIFCFFLLAFGVFLVTPVGKEMPFFFVFLGEDSSLRFLPFKGGGEMSMAPRTGDLEIRPLVPDPGKPLRAPSNEENVENCLPLKRQRKKASLYQPA
jgi:hypothetical protein